MIKPPCLLAMRYRSLLYHKSHLVNRNLHCYCFVLFSERGWGQRLKTSRILGPGGSYTATPILLTYGQVCPGYAIYPQSALPPQQVLTNHDEGTYRFWWEAWLSHRHKLEEACGPKCGIALSRTTAFLYLAKRFSLHFWGWGGAILNFITLIHILSLNGSNRTTDTHIACLKRGFIWPRHGVRLPILP